MLLTLKWSAFDAKSLGACVYRVPQEEDLFADSFDEWDTEDDEEDGRRYCENRAVR